ncbi:hypothetical protein [Hydrogenophaga sp. RWCD_12]|uniref:hypothetical protein n=1 Tax=Hydrogenophaga sp. RWCD_12 TaxID=3391190 RepID=UPI003984E454
MLIKTDKGRHELRPGNRSLGQRERALLLVADGQQSESRMADLFDGAGRQLIERLVAQGFLARIATAREAPAPIPPAAPTLPDTTTIHGEQFAGTRSLATARMFLFDLSERLFAPRDKAMASRYREALREARSPEAMLAVGRALIADVETLAGSERADGISERLAKLLPGHLLESAA